MSLILYEFLDLGTRREAALSVDTGNVPNLAIKKASVRPTTFYHTGFRASIPPGLPNMTNY